MVDLEKRHTDREDKKAFSSIGIYALSEIGRSGIGFLLLPILTRFLTPEDYGVLHTMSIIIALCVTVIGLNLSSLIVRNYIAYDRERIKKHLSNIIYAITFNFCLIFLISVVFAFLVKSFLGIPKNWLILIPVIAFLQCIAEIILCIWQARQNALKYTFFEITRTISTIGLSILFVVLLGMNWEGRILATIATFSGAAIFSLAMVMKKGLVSFGIGRNISREEMKGIFSFGLPLIPHNAGTWILYSADRIFINKMIGIATTGIYGVGRSVSGLMHMAELAFNRAYVPYVFRSLSRNDSGKTRLKLVRITYMYNVGILGCALLLYLSAKWFLPYIVGKSFVGASEYILWLGLAFALRGMYKMVVVYLLYIKEVKRLGLTTDFIAAMINIPLNFILIKRNGAIGAAQATFISFLYSYLMAWYISAKKFKMPWFHFGKVFGVSNT